MKACLIPLSALTTSRFALTTLPNRRLLKDRIVHPWQGHIGLPSLTIPVVTTASGLPIGSQLMGHPFEDELFLNLAIRLEEP
jgi:Asp-tRNA(Asn)/Glu-tRNA(Gln) amidotransferase A subunit family amidase